MPSVEGFNLSQPGQRTLPTGKLIDFQPKVLQVVDEQIAEWCRLCRIEGQMLTVFKVTTGNNDRQVGIVVTRCIAETGTHQNGRLIQQRAFSFVNAVQLLH